MSRARGNIAEDRACDYLNNYGYSILERNYYSRFGELDIIALKEETLHFIEVKSAPDYETAINNITPSKMKRIIKTATHFMTTRGVTLEYVFDAVIITPDQLEFVENITL